MLHRTATPEAMEPVARQPRLLRRGGRYTLRVKVPQELRSIVGKREVWRSLGTGDHRVALKRLRLASAEVDALFADAERKAADAGSVPSDVELHHLVRRWFDRNERAAALRFQFPATPAERQEAVANLRRDEIDLIDGAEDASVQETAKRFLVDHGIEIAGGTPASWTVVGLVQRALIEHVRRSRARLQGDIDERSFDKLFRTTAEPVPPQTAVRSDLTLGELIKRYQRDPGRSVTAKTTAKYDAFFRAIEEVLGKDTPAQQITRAECKRFQEMLTSLPPNATKRFPKLTLEQSAVKGKTEGLRPISASVANTYLNKLSKLFAWAIDEDLLEKNPAKGLRIASPPNSKKGRRKPFSTEQLNAIFGAPLYKGCQDDEDGYAEPGPNRPRRGRFWVPLLALFTGMRLNEICQLLVTDITIDDNTDVILVSESEEDGDKRVKTQAGERCIPIHPMLKQLGFLEYVAERRDAGDVRLFSELSKGSTGYYSDNFQKWFSRFLAKTGAKKPKTSFHSFRHTFRDALREADISEERVRRIGGWVGNGGADQLYGKGLRPSTLAREIKKIKFPGLGLSHLYPANNATVR
jgi:integrase